VLSTLNSSSFFFASIALALKLFPDLVAEFAFSQVFDIGMTWIQQTYTKLFDLQFEDCFDFSKIIE